eukprot:TRINITY_DN7757_c0_g1_i11.p1 TRINITY_DN7757_c0_g1~~TRINITY_DN7757_c0_g1_i11.p1  ORF type:complete len:446 (-),score=126.15 TRINITY_DN7757_c0_g1_i11:170-1507(-)
MSARNSEEQLNAALSKVNYRNSDLTKRDVNAALRHYKGLIPKADTFIFNDGTQRQLVNLAGTIPVPYKGNKYNIPVSLWLLEVHPFQAPICFVTPTQDMQIKVSKHVDSSGKIYLPYLHEWNYPSSDLLGLIQICIVTFSEQPPVYAKKTEQPQYPPQGGGLPYPTAGGGGNYPMYPPYPPSSSQPPYPPSSQAGPGAVYPNYPPSGSGYPPPPPPGYPPVQPSGGAGAGYPPPGGGGYPPPYGGGYGGGQHHQQQQPQQMQGAGYASQLSSESTGSIPQEHIRASILSAVEEKVRRRIWEEFSTLRAEQDSLKKIGEDLTSGQNRLKQMLNTLNQESEQLDNSVETLEAKNNELTDMATSLDEATEDIDVDAAVTAAAPLYRQLMAAYAEESATEDAIYFLGEGLNRGVIDCETYLKHVRNLSRKQFLLRATMRMCRQKAGLAV